MIARSPYDTILEGKTEGVYGGLSLDSSCISALQGSFTSTLNENHPHTVRSILATVILVTHPLPPSAIATLVEMPAWIVTPILTSAQSLLKPHEDPNQPVLPFHKLFSDLLTSPTRCLDKSFYIPPGKFHTEIALHCLRLMNRTLENELPVQTRGMGSEGDCPPVDIGLRYAFVFWHIHLAESKEDVTTLIPGLRCFLETRFGVWLKMLSVPGFMGVAASARENTIWWLREVCFYLPPNYPRCLPALG